MKEIKPLAALLEKLSELKVLTKTKVAEVFSDEAAEIAKQKFWQRAKELGFNPNSITNIMADPELWARAMQIGGNLVGKSYTKFADFSMQVKKVLGDIGDAAMSKLYRESLVSLDLSKAKQILSASGKVIDEAVVKEAKEKAMQLAMSGQPQDVKELMELLHQISEKYGAEFRDEKKQTVERTIDNIYEGRKTTEIHDMPGGHTIYDLFDGKIDTKHVGKTVEELRARLASQPGSDYLTANGSKMC